jgi:putative ABC transport system ATP-binding protein
MLALRELQFGYPDQGFALSVPTLDMLPGESIALVGPSGSGKTTLLNLIAGILTPAGGSITLNGEALTALPDRQRRQHRLRYMGMIFQSFELLDYLDVRDNILLQGRLCHSQKSTTASNSTLKKLPGNWVLLTNGAAMSKHCPRASASESLPAGHCC